MSRRSLLINAGKCAVGAAGITAIASAMPGFVSKANWTPGSAMGIPSQQNCTECHGTNIPNPPMAKK